MQLNHDCVRSCLLFLEDKLGVYNAMYVDDVVSGLSEKYTEDEIVYSLIKLREAKYIEGGLNVMHDMHGTPSTINLPITEITYKGHQYLDTIKDNSVWHQIKDKTSSLKSVPLSILSSIGTEIIKQKLGY